MKSYIENIHKVLSYIDSHLDEAHNLDKLSQKAHLSKFHFHRIMKAYLNESLGSYINRIRMETAIKLIRYSNQSVKDIGYNIGYQTPAAFNKAFKKLFDTTPLEIRKNNFIKPKDEVKKSAKQFEFLVTEKTFATTYVIYQQSRGAIGGKETSESWDNFFINANKSGLINLDTKFYGINWDDPEVTETSKIRYDACISVSESTIDSFSVRTITGGKHLCFLYKGDYQNLSAVYDCIFREWIIKKEIELREVPVFEHYINNKVVTNKEDLLTEIYVPINN